MNEKPGCSINNVENRDSAGDIRSEQQNMVQVYLNLHAYEVTVVYS